MSFRILTLFKLKYLKNSLNIQKLNHLQLLEILTKVFMLLEAQAKIISKNQKGKEFRPSYFTSLQRNLLYGLVLNLPDVAPEDIVDDSKINSIFEKLTEYANGGLQWIRDHIFGNVLNEKGEIDVDSETVIIRLNEMIHDEINPEKAPF